VNDKFRTIFQNKNASLVDPHLLEMVTYDLDKSKPLE